MKSRLEPYRLPLHRPLTTAAGPITFREGVVLYIEDEEGRIGRGDAAPLPGFSTETLDETRAALDLWQPGVPFAGPPSAAHAVEQALLDLEAQSAGRSMAKQLSEGAAESLPISRLVRDAAEAAEAVKLGFKTVKVKVGFRVPAQRDAEMVAAVRQAIGPDIALRLDANRGWTVEEARKAIAALAPYNPEFIEEPIKSGDPVSLSSLRGIIPIAADESMRSASDLEALIAANAVDLVVVKPMMVGGIRTARRLIRRALSAGMSAVVTTSIESVVGRRAALHLAASVPTLPPPGLDTGRLLARDLGPDLRIENGVAWL